MVNMAKINKVCHLDQTEITARSVCAKLCISPLLGVAEILNGFLYFIIISHFTFINTKLILIKNDLEIHKQVKTSEIKLLRFRRLHDAIIKESVNEYNASNQLTSSDRQRSYFIYSTQVNSVVLFALVS